MSTEETRERAVDKSTEPKVPTATPRDDGRRFRLVATMAQGLADTLPEAWRSYPGVDDARLAARQMLQDPRVLQVVIVEDRPPLRFIESVGR